MLFKEATAKLSDGYECEGRQQEHQGQKKISLSAIEERVDAGQAHVLLLRKWEHLQAESIVCRQAVAQPEEQSELPAKQRRREKKRDELAASERIAQTQAREASQQREILVKGKQLKDRTLPADYGELEKQAQGCRGEDGNPQIFVRRGI